MKSILFAKFCQVAGYISLISLLVYSLTYGITWLIISFIFYKLIVGLLGNQIAQHRYFSHKGFETGPWRHKFLAFMSIFTGASPVVYASIHRYHHLHSDTPSDPHSPQYSFWNSFVGWTFKLDRKIKPAWDLLKDPTVLYMHKNFAYIITLILFLTFLLDWKISVFVVLAGVGWNSIHMGLIRSVLVHTRILGSYRNFETSDNSWNNKFIQILDIGEGLHNNHHRYPMRYNQAIMKHEFDPAGWLVEKLFIKKC